MRSRFGFVSSADMMTLRTYIPCTVFLIAGVAAMAALSSVGARSQPMPPNGRGIWEANCATCHGLDGRGKRTKAEIGFELPMPNFADCSFATREADADWSSTIHRGGRQRAFSRIMPAFDKALNDDEIDAVIGYMRTFCVEPGWVSGEFNFALGLFTEKAFVEDELVWTTAIDTHGPTNIGSQFVYEKRFGPRGQLELTLPFGLMDPGGGLGTRGGLGDVGVAWKQNIYNDRDQGGIVSLLGEMVLPTGNERFGLGAGSLAFETHALFAQMLPDDFVFQGQVFGSFPLRTGHADEAGWRFNIGKTFAEDEGYARAWTPMLELLGSHEFVNGAKVDWDIVPQMQVSLSTRQHILFNAGARIPLNDTSVRNTQFVFYFIWDWYDGGLFEAW
jgi:mono/diheme cytochrome c family protein